MAKTEEQPFKAWKFNGLKAIPVLVRNRTALADGWPYREESFDDGKHWKHSEPFTDYGMTKNSLIHNRLEDVEKSKESFIKKIEELDKIMEILKVQLED
jgi:hypothetical protein